MVFSTSYFDRVISHFPDMSVDLFASRLNCKLATFVSRRAEPHVLAVDAFSIVWNDHLFYIFPPFSLMAKILQKMEQDSTEAVVIAHSGLVGVSPTHDKRTLFSSTKSAGHYQPSAQTRISAPSEKDALGCFSITYKALQRQGIPREAENVIITSWRDCTKRQYNCYIQRWILYCGQDRNPIKPTVNDF